MLQVGVDATDREINEALYGAAPPGSDFLVIGHESFGRVLEVGPDVKTLQRGDFVACTVRRPGGSLYDKIGRNDITSEETYYERGINLCHGYMTEKFVDDAEYMVKVPQNLQASRRPERAGLRLRQGDRAGVPGAVADAGLGAEAGVRDGGRADRPAGDDDAQAPRDRRLHGGHPPGAAPEVGDRRGATAPTTSAASRRRCVDLAKQVGKPDLIIEATGNAGVCFQAMEVLAHNGVLVWTSITGGQYDVTFNGAKINLEWVLGNKLLVGSVNGNRRHFEQGIQAMSLGEQTYPGVTGRILTNPIDGFDQYADHDEAARRQGSPQGLRQHRQVRCDRRPFPPFLSRPIDPKRSGDFHERPERAPG